MNTLDLAQLHDQLVHGTDSDAAQVRVGVLAMEDGTATAGPIIAVYDDCLIVRDLATGRTQSIQRDQLRLPRRGSPHDKTATTYPAAGIPVHATGPVDLLALLESIARVTHAAACAADNEDTTVTLAGLDVTPDGELLRQLPLALEQAEAIVEKLIGSAVRGVVVDDAHRNSGTL